MRNLIGRRLGMRLGNTEEAKQGEAFVANTMYYLVVEPMTEESDVFVEQELVEE